jgi:hypothetical protein
VFGGRKVGAEAERGQLRYGYSASRGTTPNRLSDGVAIAARTAPSAVARRWRGLGRAPLDGRLPRRAGARHAL